MAKENLETGNVSELVRRLESQFIDGTSQVSQYVDQNPYEDISKIEAYLNSKHTSGLTDALGRDKPFFNIVLAARNIVFRATDLDRKDARIEASNVRTTLAAFIATLKLQEWMRKSDFGRFLNNWGLNLSGYNECAVKFVEQDGELRAMVVPWDRLIFDCIDFDNNPKIEILELTPAQLRQREGYDQELVKSLLDATTARKQMGRQNKDTKSDYIRLYEIHGNLPLSYLTGKEKDVDTYVQQMHVISFVGKGRGEYDDYCLVKGKEERDPYMLTALMPEIDGSVKFNGAVKNLFDTQWMVNHTAKQIKDQLDLASMLLFQTSDGNFTSQNALTAMSTGDILIHAPNQPITQVQNNSHDITALQNYSAQWRALGQEITSTPDVMMGKNMPSGTAFRQAAIIQQESLSNFQIMTENKGMYLEKMIKTFVIPFLKKQLNNKDEIIATLDSSNIDKIDKMYVPREATKRTAKALVQKVLNGEDITQEMAQDMTQQNTQDVNAELSSLEGNRYLTPDEMGEKTWKQIMDGLEWNAKVDPTGEQGDKNTILTTLTELLGTVAKNPAMLQDPNAKMLFNKILSESGVVSPIEIKEAQAMQSQGQTPNLSAEKGVSDLVGGTINKENNLPANRQ